VAKPRKPPVRFDPIGDLLRSLERSPYPVSRAEGERRFDAAVAKVRQKGGDALVLRHLDRHFPPEPLPLEERVRRWGGRRMVEHFKVLRKLDVSAEGQEKIWRYLDSLRSRPSLRIALSAPEVHAYLKALRKWFREGWRLLVRPDHAPPTGLGKIVEELRSFVVQAQMQILYLPAVWSRTRRASAPKGFDTGKARTDLVKLMKAHVTEWQKAKKIHREALEKLAAQMLQTMGVQRYRRTEAEIQAGSPHPRDLTRSER
jgi:hypothetical protein